jgi:biopolymer transport protein ExbB
MNVIIQKSLFFLLLCCLPLYTWAQSVQQVRATARNDLKNSIERLSLLRQQIEKEKSPLSQNVSKLEREARDKRTEIDRRLRQRDNRDASLLQLKEEVRENEAALASSLRLLKDFARTWVQSIPSSERILYSDSLSATLAKEQGDRASAFSAYLEIADLSTTSLLKQAGGASYRGDAIVPPEGIRETGTFWTFGPLLYFRGELGSSGFLDRSYERAESSNMELSADSVKRNAPPRVLVANQSSSQLIKQSLQNEEGSADLATLPMDPSLGKALVIEGSEPTLLEEMQKGGIWIYPILFFAVISVLIALVKAFQVLRIPFPHGPVTLAGNFGGPFELLRKTAQGYRGKKPEILEEILYEIIIEWQARLEKGMPLIAITAATAPLLGLLGTVTGMIDVFRQITNFANPENSELARGISEALVTTKFGLITAIPSLIAHALLSRRLQGLVSKMEGFSSRLVHLKKETPRELTSEIPKKDESVR